MPLFLKKKPETLAYICKGDALSACPPIASSRSCDAIKQHSCWKRAGEQGWVENQRRENDWEIKQIGSRVSVTNRVSVCTHTHTLRNFGCDRMRCAGERQHPCLKVSGISGKCVHMFVSFALSGVRHWGCAGWGRGTRTEHTPRVREGSGVMGYAWRKCGWAFLQFCICSKNL